MACPTVCKLCDNFIISQSVTFTDGKLVINIPAGDYQNRHKYCLVVAQAIPTTTTIVAPVVITIGEGTVEYPLTRCNCSQVTACGIRTRTRYSTTVVTDGDSGVFRLMGNPCACPNNNLASINGTAPAAPAAPAETTPTT